MKKLLAILIGIGLLAGLSVNAAPLSGQQGGTGWSSTTAANIGKCLSITSVTPLAYTWATCAGGGGGGDGTWSTSTGLVYMPSGTEVLVGGNATTSGGYVLEVIGNSLFGGNITVTGIIAGYATSGALTSYLTTASSTVTYLTNASATTNYVPWSSASTSNWTLAYTYGVITNASSGNWNTAYGWGNHATAGYLLSSASSTFLTVASSTVTYLTNASATTNYVPWSSASTSNWTLGYTYGVITNASSGNWNTAYGWGNHSIAGYASTGYAGFSWASTSYAWATATDAKIGTLTNLKWCSSDGSKINCTENAPAGGGGGSSWSTSTDLIYTTEKVLVGASATTTGGYAFEVVGNSLFDGVTASGDVVGLNITTASTSNWNLAYTYGVITNASSGNWNTAYGWGNHASAGYLLSSASSTFLTTASSTVTYLTNASATTNYVPWSNASTSNWTLAYTYGVITNASSGNWNTSYGWGNHASAGYATTATVGLTNYYGKTYTDTNYLATGTAASTYLTLSASSTFLTTASSTVTYLTNASATLNYMTISSTTANYMTIASNTATDIHWSSASTSKYELTYSNFNASSSNWNKAYGNSTMNAKLTAIGALASTSGNIIVGNGNTFTVLTSGASGQALTSNGAGVVPSWQTPSSTAGVTSLNTLTGGLTLWGSAPVTITASSTTGLVIAVANAATTGVATLSSLASVGTITTGTWSATAITNAKGGTGQDSSAWTGNLKVVSGTWATSTIHECFSLENASDTDDNVPISTPDAAITITRQYCRTQGGTSVTMHIGDGTNNMEDIVCDSDGQADDGSLTNNTFTANERMEFDVTSVSGSVTWFNWCNYYYIN